MNATSIYILLLAIVQGVFFCLFFYRMADIKFTYRKDLPLILFLTAAYTVFMFYTDTLIIEPFYSILSMLLLAVPLKFLKKLDMGYSFFIIFIARLICICI